MSINFTLESANVVILARNYNTSIVSKEWLYEKKIINEAVTNFIHSPVLSVVETGLLNLVVDENRLQISIKNVNNSSMKRLPKVAGSFVSMLPETPYIATGYNFKYRIEEEYYHLKEWFSPDDRKFKEIFSDAYTVGLIISFQFESFTARMTTPPIVSKDKDVLLDINFHSVCKNAEEVLDRLNQHNKTREKAESILTEISKE